VAGVDEAQMVTGQVIRAVAENIILMQGWTDGATINNGGKRWDATKLASSSPPTSSGRGPQASATDAGRAHRRAAGAARRVARLLDKSSSAEQVREAEPSASMPRCGRSSATSACSRPRPPAMRR